MPRSLQPMRGALLAIGLAALAVTAAPAGAAEHAPVPQLQWKDCDDGFQCATATVPLDHSRPRGRTIDLALVRFPATDREHRIGSLFMNPGGPGGSGVEFVRTMPASAERWWAAASTSSASTHVGSARAARCRLRRRRAAIRRLRAALPAPETLDVPALSSRGQGVGAA